MADKARIRHLKPTLWIGKLGCTGSVIEEIRRQLKDEGIIKIRWLRNTEIDPGLVASQAGADLIDVRGRTMVLAERRV